MMKKFVIVSLCLYSTSLGLKLGAQIIADGEYYIQITQIPEKRIDLTDGLANQGNNIQLSESKNLPNQKWKVENQPDGTVIIRYAAAPNLVMDNYDNRIQNKNNIWLFEDNGTNAQRWIIKQGAHDSFFIRKADNPDYVITSSNVTPGSNIILFEDKGATNQIWNFISVNPSNIKFKKDKKGRLDLTGHSYEADYEDALITIDFDSSTVGYPSLSVSSKKKSMGPGRWGFNQPDTYSYDGRNIELDYLGYYGTVSADGKTINLNLVGNKLVFKVVR